MRKLISFISALTLSIVVSFAQIDLEAEFFSLPETVTPEYLDSIKIQSVKPNDYWEVGVFGGASLQYGFFNPTRLVTWHMNYPVYGFSLIRHFTMFGIFPNMALEVGAQQNYEGYEFKLNEETGRRSTEAGSYAVTMKVPELFFLSHFHVDMGQTLKILAKAGLYGGYRTSIERSLDPAFASSGYTAYVNEFREYDRRWTYGVQGGFGLGLMFDPIEFHINVQVKWGWESFWDPDTKSSLVDTSSPYYYRFAYPLDLAPTFGVYYHLTPRHGHSRSQLKKMAKEIVNQ
ncbi:MAG: outer membrane beta-barrel protein [Bacteroidales bacterium]|nr:outer membrane beta-barrel protein [Bacteroidales bacterium]